MIDSTILCICISTYNRAEKAEMLVKEILKCRSEQLSIVVVDDHSTDDTVSRIKKIDDDRLRVYSNSTNLGAKQNWYETLQRGEGKYLLHLVDRDWIRVQYLSPLIELLKTCDAGFGYIGSMISHVSYAGGKNCSVELYRKGYEAMEKFAFTLVHPSGFLVLQEAWNQLSSKRQVFKKDRCGIYPHAYIFAMLGQRYHGIKINYRMISIAGGGFARYKSKFYVNQRNKRSYWWTPEAFRNELNSLSRFAVHKMKFDERLIRKILKYRFSENLYMATLCYKENMRDTEIAIHYGQKKEYISLQKLKQINAWFTSRYIAELHKNEKSILNFDFMVTLLRIAKKNDRSIEAVYCKEGQQTDKFKSQYQMLAAWMKIKQRNIAIESEWKAKQINKVAIYGNGENAQLLYQELKNTDIEVNCFIDKNASHYIENIPVLTICEEIPPVDLIIVSIIDEFETIRSELEKVCHCQIMPMDEMIYQNVLF